jgi:Protein of unknown function (DUF3102)
MTTVPAPTQQQPASISTISDADLIKSINDKVRSMLVSYRSSVGHAVEVGELLKEAKARVGHGNFEPWLKEHCNLSFRTARRYMKLAENRPQIEAQFKSANVADLTLSGAQRLLTDNSAGSGGKSGGGNSGDGSRTPAGDYDKLEEKLIDKLKELDASEAKDHADRTIASLNDTVADIVNIAKRAATKAAKLGAVAHPSQA